jgi:FtsH-binding integral membrane protein
MKWRRQEFIAFVLLTALVSLSLFPLLPVAAPGRHHVRTAIVALAWLADFSFIAVSLFFTFPATDKSILVPKNLFELHCSRLC